jgi:hypothetical protein
MTTTSQSPLPSAVRAVPRFQWSPSLKPEYATVLYWSSCRPDAAASRATVAGRSLDFVKLLPIKRTRSGVASLSKPACEAPASSVALASSAPNRPIRGIRHCRLA